MKKCSKLCSEARTHGWISQVAHGLQAARRCTRVKHVQKLNRHASCSTIGQKFQSSHSVILQLGLATQSHCEAKSPVHFVIEKLTLHIPFSLQYKYRELLERILRYKPQRKTRLIHPQSLHSDSSNSSTFTLSIVTSLRGSLAKTFLTIPISVRRLFGALGSNQEGTNSHWLMLWVIAESGKLKKKQVRRNLVGVRAWRA